MEIIWYGLSCFKLTDRGTDSVITDPFDGSALGYEPLRISGEIVTISQDTPGHNALNSVKGSPYVVDGPGEYEVGGVFITGIQTVYPKEPAEPRNTLYVFDFNSLTVAHLGALNRLPTQAEIEAMGTIHVALVPISGGPGMSASRAVEITSLLEPSIVIPMHCADKDKQIPLDSLSKFLKEMGISEVETQTSLRITTANLPEEPKVVVLEAQYGTIRSTP